MSRDIGDGLSVGPEAVAYRWRFFDGPDGFCWYFGLRAPAANSARSTPEVEALGVIGPVSPGDPIAEVTCPCCSAALCVEHGDEPGEVVVIGVPVEGASAIGPVEADDREKIERAVAEVREEIRPLTEPLGRVKPTGADYATRVGARIDGLRPATREPGAPTVEDLRAAYEREKGAAGAAIEHLIAAHSLLTAAGVPEGTLVMRITALTAGPDHRLETIRYCHRILDEAGRPDVGDDNRPLEARVRDLLADLAQRGPEGERLEVWADPADVAAWEGTHCTMAVYSEPVEAATQKLYIIVPPEGAP